MVFCLLSVFTVNIGINVVFRQDSAEYSYEGNASADLAIRVTDDNIRREHKFSPDVCDSVNACDAITGEI